jgi:hypothetical protein
MKVWNRKVRKSDTANKTVFKLVDGEITLQVTHYPVPVRSQPEPKHRTWAIYPRQGSSQK